MFEASSRPLSPPLRDSYNRNPCVFEAIRPERVGSSYTIAWTTLYFDREAQEWIPLYDRARDDTDDD